MIFRLFIGIPSGAVVTLLLFLVMQALITGDRNLLQEVIETEAINITRAERDEQSEADRRQPDRPTEQDQPPPPPPMDTNTNRPDLSGINFSLPGIDTSIGDLSNIGPVDGDIQPLVRVQPEFPARAAERGQSGRVCVEFTVTPEGTVTNPQVYESSSRMFDSAALRAIRGFRYQPRIVDGEPAPRPGVRNCFDFVFQDAGRGR